MTTIALPGRLRVPFLPFDEEEAARPRARGRRLPRSLAAWLLLPGLVALVVVGTMYAAFSARATALTYQIATLRAEKTQLQLRQQLQAERLDQLQSAGQVAASATHLGMTPPPTWTVVTPNSAADPLTPVLVALRGG